MPAGVDGSKNSTITHKKKQTLLKACLKEAEWLELVIYFKNKLVRR